MQSRNQPLAALTVQVATYSVDEVDLVFFFFQAEDGIRDLIVTGVQTCALPIWSPMGREVTKTAVRLMGDRPEDDPLVQPEQVDRREDDPGGCERGEPRVRLERPDRKSVV